LILSDELLTGQESVEAQFDRVPMPEAPADDSTFADAREAAEHLVKQREETQPEALPIEEIKYVERGKDGELTDKPYGERAYVSAERASDDLKAFRDQRAEVNKQAELEATRQFVDEARGQPAAAADDGLKEWGDRQNVRAYEQQQALPTEADLAQAGREMLSQIDRAIAAEGNPETINALQARRGEISQQVMQSELNQVLAINPAIAAGLEAEVARQTQAAAATVQAYQQQIAQAAQYAAAVVYAEPEFRGLNANQIPTVMQLLARDNPQRYQQIVARAQAADQLIAQHNQLAAHQQAQAQRAQHENFNRWAAQEDQTWEEQNAHIPAAEMAQLKAEAKAMLNETGLDDDQIRMLYNSAPWFRSVTTQNVMRDAAAYRIAQRATREARVTPPAPRVMRPGGGDDLDLRSGYQDAPRLPPQFASVKDAARFLSEARSRRK
jgi:hypothetical protein